VVLPLGVVKLKRPRKETTLLYILTGQDDFSRSEALAEIKRGIGEATLLAANTTILNGEQLTLDQLRNVGETIPFLTEKRLVIIEGLLGRFEAKGKPSRQPKAKLATKQQSEYKQWANYLSNMPESTVVVLVDDGLKSSNPLFRELSGSAEVKSFPPLNKTRLRQWVEKGVGEAGGRISPEAAELLVQIVGSNLWTMRQEISKLVLFASGRLIEEDDVRRLVSDVQQISVFNMVDAIFEFKAGAAGRLLQQLLDTGAVPAYLLVMLSRQIRMIARIKELQNQGKSESEIQSRLGLVSEFAFRKTLTQASRYPWERIREVYHKLLEADLSIKTGIYDGELALNILITELCQRTKGG
jgi:DNA polymerase-3 subunit delta